MGRSAETRPTVLVVEDDGLVRVAITCELEQVGYTVAEAMDSDGALSILKEGCEPDLLFTDIRLPGSVDGWKLAEAARAARPGLPVIYTTGYAEIEAPRLCRSLFLRKPYVPSAVIWAAMSLGIPPLPRTR